MGRNEVMPDTIVVLPKVPFDLWPVGVRVFATEVPNTS